MRGTHAATGFLGTPTKRQRRHPRHPRAYVSARLRAHWLDIQLASGIAPWRSPVHAARARQLTGNRMRRAVASGFERLLVDAERPARQFRHTAAIRPCREQVRAAAPLIDAIVLQLRSDAPLDARGVARLQLLITDGSGPCYVQRHPQALTAALQTAMQWLEAPD